VNDLFDNNIILKSLLKTVVDKSYKITPNGGTIK
jgi:hypothetical protein